MSIFKRGQTGSRSLNRLFDNITGAAAAGAVATEALGGVVRTTIRLDEAELALTDVADVVAYAAKKVYDFPDGSIVILGATANLTLSASSAGVNATFDGDFSVGTVAAAGDATLTATEANVIPSTATPQAVGGDTTAKGRSTDVVSLDGSGAGIDLYLNLVVDDADQDVTTTPASLIVSGTITIVWAALGDY